MRRFVFVFILALGACGGITDADREGLPRHYSAGINGVGIDQGIGHIAARVVAATNDSTLSTMTGDAVFREDHTTRIITTFAVQRGSNGSGEVIRAYADTVEWTFEARTDAELIVIHHPADARNVSIDTARVWDVGKTRSAVLRVPRRMRFWNQQPVDLVYILNEFTP